MRNLITYGVLLLGISAHAGNLIANGDFSQCEKGKLPAECRAEDGVRVSLFTEDLTWNRCLKAAVSRAYTNAANNVISWSGSAFMGASDQLGFPVAPFASYDVAVDLRSEQDVPVKVVVTFWKGDCQKWKDRVEVPIITGAYRPGKDWKTVRGTVRALEGAKLAAIRLGFSGSTEAGRNKLKVGDWVLADNFSFALSRKNLAGVSSSAEIDVPPRKAIATGDAVPVSDFYDLKKSMPSDVRTALRAWADKAALVLAFEADEPLAIVTGETNKVWSGDSFEFFVMPADGKLRHFAFNLAGAQFANFGDGKNIGGAGWTVSTERLQAGFRSTARVPFSLLGFSSVPKPGTRVKFNAGRNRSKAKEFIGWAKSGGGFADVSTFGDLIFGHWAEALNAEFGEKRALACREDYVKACAEIKRARLRAKFAKFRNRKFSVAVLPVVSDYTCPFLPEEVFDPPTNISLVAAVNEVKAMPLAVANLTDRLEDCLVMLETEADELIGDFGLQGFPSGQITVRRAARMRDAAGDTPTMRFDPLMPSEKACVVSVPSHEASLVWFDFNTTDVKPGTYRGRIRIIPLGEEGTCAQRPKGGWADREYRGKMLTLPISLEVQPIKLARRSPIPSGFFMHVPNEAAYNLAADLGAECHQISPWRFPIAGDSPEVDLRIKKDREWAAKRGFRPRFDILYSAYVQRLDGLKNPEKANKVWVPYLQNVKRIMNANGVPDEEYWIETADEPKQKDLKILIAAHRLAKSAVPSVRLGVTIAAWELPEAEMRELAKVTDVFILWGRSYFTEPWKMRLVEEFRARGGMVCHYMCDTSMRQSLNTYFRHHAWIGERYRLDGNYLYEFSKLIKRFGATDFKEPTAGDIVCYAYGKAIPSVRYCAFREGITDVKYMAALRAVAGNDPEARELLDRAAKEVLEVSPRDPTTPDRLREKARELLLKHTVSPAARPLVAAPNVALGKPVEFLPKMPDYECCTDPDDVRQLTDGTVVTAPGQMWIHKGCVGWKNNGNKAFGVKLDLGADTPISGFSWHVGSGSAGVAFPQSVLVYVSLDGVNWAFAGDLLGKALTLRPMPAPGTYSTYKAWSDDLPCHGRWVMFVVQQSLYTFVDEIEVYRGSDDFLTRPYPAATTTDPIDSGRSVRFRLRMLADAEKSGAAKDPLIRKRIGEFDFETQVRNCRAILPLGDLHAEIYAANVANLRAAGFTHPVCWTNNRWANLDPLTVPPRAAVSNDPIQIHTMRGEVRSAAVNVLNPTDKPLECRVSAEGFPDGTEIELREVVFTDTAWFRPVSGALKAGKDGTVAFTIPAGISKQVWIKSVRPTGAAGLRTGILRARLSDGSELTRPLIIHVYDLDYPKESRLQVGGWDYLNNPNYYRNPGATASKIALHREMGVNVAWATGGVRPTGEKFDAAGHLVSTLDFSKWDAWTRNVVPDFRTHAVFLALGKSFGGEAIGTERFEVMAKEYFAAWGAHVRATMRHGQRVLLQVVDEPRNAEQANVAIHWMRAVKAAACPAFVTYMDPLFPDGFDAKIDPAFWDLCDIVCPQGIGAAKAAEFRAKGQDVYLYSCIGPSRTFDPQSYYRLSAWRVFAVGGKGMFYWAFGCGGGTGDSWRPYAQKGTEYSPYFVSMTDATPAKQSEAIRESIEDFEYLSMLAERCGAEKAAKAARSVLDNYPTGDPDWNNPALTDAKRNLMDEMCGTILKQLEKRAPRGKMLAIGDSITAAGIWQKRTGELLGMDVRSHCKGGIDAVSMVDWKGDAPPEYDPDNFGVRELYNLSVKDVTDIDFIFIMGFYNEVGRIYKAETRGVGTDLYPQQNTFCGRVNYALRRIRETLAAAKNEKARIVLVSPHRYGTNGWVDRTSYEVADLWLSALRTIAARNDIPLVDLLNGGGIGRENWDRYQRSPTALDARYLPADGSANAGTNCPFATLAAAPNPASCKGRLVTVRGERGHYASDGKVWKKETAPYPWFADQLHLNADGYRLLGEAIAREARRLFRVLE